MIGSVINRGRLDAQTGVFTGGRQYFYYALGVTVECEIE